MTLNDKGFNSKKYEDLLEESQSKARELFGDNINVSSSGVLGMFTRLFSWFTAQLYDLSEKVYQSAYVSTANGIQLDRLANNRGLSRNKAAESYATLEVLGEKGYIIEVGTEFSTATNLYFMVYEESEINDDGKGYCEVVSVGKGVKYNVLSNTINLQSEPVEQITSVTNLSAAVGGQENETDLSLANRIRSGSESNKGTLNGIISALNAVSGVTAALVIENNTNDTDAEGNPPKSVHAYLLGGTNNDIAKTLFESMPAGISTVGNQMQLVADISGTVHEVKFDYAINKDIYSTVNVKRTALFSSDGEEMIKENLISLIGGTYGDKVYDSQGLGKNVVLSRLYRGITVEGIEDIQILIGTTQENVSEKNIVIESKEVATIKPENIKVVIS